MANLLTSLLRRQEISRYSLSEYIRKRVEALSNPFGFAYAEPSYQAQSYGRRPVEKAEDTYASLASYAYRGDSVVASCMRVRRDLFRQAKFCWREVDDGGPGKIFRDDQLALLDKPWPNGTTGELLARMITDVDLCGNSFIANDGERLRWLRPDWVDIVLSGDPMEDANVDVLGYVYTPGGMNRPAGQRQAEGVPYRPEDICHWAPDQDPLAFYRGMSWVSKALEEVQGDRAATTHKMAFFRNGATLGPIVRVPAGTTVDQFKEFIRANEEAHAGAGNAYKTMYVGGGAEVTLAAADFRQLDLKSVQGGMETRIAAVAGVHPVLVGLSEGLSGSSLNSGNFAAAKRATAEMTLTALWQDACGALSAFFDVPKDAELWIRERDIPFLRDEAKDRADILHTQIMAIEAGMRAGFKPDPTVQAVMEERLDLLVGNHTGMFSVQMQAPQQGGADVNGDGVPDGGPDGAPAGPPPDFGALRDSLRFEVTEADIERAIDAYLDEDEALRARYDVRNPAGSVGGGRFRKLSDSVVMLLKDWAKGEGPDDPLDDYSRDQLVRITKQVRQQALDAGDNERAARLTPRRGASSDELKLALYKDVRGSVRGQRDSVDKPDAKFTLQGKGHRDLDVGVFKDADGRPRLFEQSDAGKRGSLVEKFDSLAELEQWAKDNGEPRLASWAGKERKKLPEGGALGLYTPAEVEGLAKGLDMTVPESHKVTSAEGKRRVEAVLDDVDRVLADGGSNRALLATLKGHRDSAPKGVVDELTKAAESGDKDRLRKVSADIRARVGEPGKASGKAAPDAKQARVAKIASAFHEDWRKTRLQKDGTYEPRVKKTKDQAWIDAHGTDDVDIANTSYDDLPADWQAENKAAAEVVEGILRKRGGKVDLSDEATRQEVGEEIHKAWLDRNKWAAGGELDVPFEDLPADEQAKDIDQLKVAMGVSGIAEPSGPGGRHTPTDAEKAYERAFKNDDEFGALQARVDDYREQYGRSPDPDEVKSMREQIRRDFERRRRGPLFERPPAAPRKSAAPAKAAAAPTRADVSKAPSRKVGDLKQGDRLYVFIGRYGAQAKAPEAGTHGLDPDPSAATISRITPDGRIYIRTDSRFEGELLGPGGAALRPNRDTVRIIPEAKDTSPGERLSSGRASKALTPARKATPAKTPPEGFDPAQLDGLTVRQKRARLKAMGFSQDQIDELAPTAAAAKKAAPKGQPRESVLGDGPMDEYEEALHGLTAAQVKQVAEEMNISKPVGGPWPASKAARIRYMLTSIDDARRRNGPRSHGRYDIPRMIESLGLGPSTAPRSANPTDLDRSDLALLRNASNGTTKTLGTSQGGRDRNEQIDRLVAAGYLRQEGGSADLTGAGGLSSDPAVRAVQMENRIRAAYRKLEADPDRLERQRARIIQETGLTPLPGYGGLAGSEDWVGIADIRDELGEGVDRREVDEALARMGREGAAVISSQADQKVLLQRDRDSAVRIGGESKHAIHLDDPSLRPLPGAVADRYVLTEKGQQATGGQLPLAERSAGLDPDDIERAEDDLEDEDDLDDDEPVDEMDLALEHYQPLDAAARSRAMAMRAVGHDVTPGHDELHHYWTRGEGLAKWAGSPKPWTTLVGHLTKYVGPEKAKVFASRWFLEVFHFASGSDLNRVTHGKPPRGHRVGPG